MVKTSWIITLVEKLTMKINVKGEFLDTFVGTVSRIFAIIQCYHFDDKWERFQ